MLLVGRAAGTESDASRSCNFSTRATVRTQTHIAQQADRLWPLHGMTRGLRPGLATQNGGGAAAVPPPFVLTADLSRGRRADAARKLKTALKADIDADAWATLYRTESLPFDKPETARSLVA